MSKRQTIDLGNGVQLIDLHDMGYEMRTGAYVIQGHKDYAVIETGASPSLPYLQKGLEELRIALEDVSYLIVTHVHLDHAGGAGQFMQLLPNARLVVHPKGASHMIDPSKLIEGARAVYGKRFETLFSPILPIAKERVLVKTEGESLDLGGRTLHFLDTPGHAFHHFAIYDPASSGIFTGDNVGIRYPKVEDAGLHFFFPSTSPTQFDPDSMLATATRFASLRPSRLYLGHFGMSEEVEKVLESLLLWVPRLVRCGQLAVSGGEGVDGVLQRIRQEVSQVTKPWPAHLLDKVQELLDFDCLINAQGIHHFLMRQLKH